MTRERNQVKNFLKHPELASEWRPVDTLYENIQAKLDILCENLNLNIPEAKIRVFRRDILDIEHLGSIEEEEDEDEGLKNTIRDIFNALFGLEKDGNHKNPAVQKFIEESSEDVFNFLCKDQDVDPSSSRGPSR